MLVHCEWRNNNVAYGLLSVCSLHIEYTFPYIATLIISVKTGMKIRIYQTVQWKGVCVHYKRALCSTKGLAVGFLSKASPLCPKVFTYRSLTAWPTCLRAQQLNHQEGCISEGSMKPQNKMSSKWSITSMGGDSGTPVCFISVGSACVGWTAHLCILTHAQPRRMWSPIYRTKRWYVQGHDYAWLPFACALIKR